jgi:hypothetical protein
MTPFHEEAKEQQPIDAPPTEWEPSYAAAFDVYWKCLNGAVLVHPDGAPCNFKPMRAGAHDLCARQAEG